ncbi:tetratricopeptide repeat protein [Pontibacter sp. 172403-2]|uniref:tetratricopeptide repeat protein n=1 Tax=Pontibacter rufus TaxID=2791028 RepID=UPI0018AF70CD|nr:tetratricopeptide repeat protein [Pontibacter sp. 172403-2]MBF9254793.1 tetratricopeptide repeat protein [Pontibacter sp. 172403-2]
MVRFSRLLLLLSLVVAACSQKEGAREQMVNLQQVQDNPQAQLANLNAAIRQSGRDGSLYARRAVALLRKGELNKALEDANEAVVLTRNEPAALFVKAQVLRAMGKSREALPLALQAERNSYQNASLYVLLAELYLQQHKYRQALEYISKAQELSPASEFAYYYKGRLLAATGDTAKAIRNYKLALEQMPQLMEAQRELAGILVARQDYAGAETYLSRAEKLNPDDALLLYYKGLLYQAAQKPDSARQYFLQAVATIDTLQRAHYFIGLQLYANGDGEGALNHLLKAEKQYKDSPKYLATLAGSYERTGQPAQALATYRRLLQVEPGYTYAYQAIARLNYKLQKPRKPEVIEELEIR